MQSFTYRPGSLRAPVPLELGVTGMRHRGGPLRPWGTLVGLRLQRWQSGGILGVSFSLRFETGTEVIAAGYRPEEPEVPRLLHALLRQIAQARPDMQVALGPGPGLPRAMSALGGLSLVAGIGILAGGVASGLSGARLIGATVPVAILLLLGAGLIALFRWPSAPQERPVGQVLADLGPVAD